MLSNQILITKYNSPIVKFTLNVEKSMVELYLVISIWFDNMHEKAAFQPLLSQLNGKHIRDSNQDDNKNEINRDSQKSYANYQANEISKINCM